MTDRGRYIHLPEGETVTIRFLDLDIHAIVRTKEEIERYLAMTHDCSICEALKEKP